MSAQRRNHVVQDFFASKGAILEERRFKSSLIQERLRKLGAFPAARNVVVDGKNEVESRLPREVYAVHRKACDAGNTKYIDPLTGQIVPTRHFHLQRGICCGNRCRHCPFGHVNVPSASGTN
ncbi:cob(I)alamin adenosyltransferase [Trypanosoma theileri]|uniref:Cob(I)alamin adenosyltransferase n=1 Tax=Trypanosoma theileri TaxID=67003 RepID=A0A1X0NVZ0_9TRYP|nr:cob(I)alamin adenosyltransferase [Trypanosoma theileri]ORC88874.1 cob(I)alamin adenosyltransferase [Trypanosoma theileri]